MRKEEGGTVNTVSRVLNTYFGPWHRKLTFLCKSEILHVYTFDQAIVYKKMEHITVRAGVMIHKLHEHIRCQQVPIMTGCASTSSD